MNWISTDLFHFASQRNVNYCRLLFFLLLRFVAIFQTNSFLLELLQRRQKIKCGNSRLAMRQWNMHEFWISNWIWILILKWSQPSEMGNCILHCIARKWAQIAFACLQFTYTFISYQLVRVQVCIVSKFANNLTVSE